MILWGCGVGSRPDKVVSRHLPATTTGSTGEVQSFVDDALWKQVVKLYQDQGNMAQAALVDVRGYATLQRCPMKERLQMVIERIDKAYGDLDKMRGLLGARRNPREPREGGVKA